MKKIFKAAVVGLGNIGFRLDLDRKRRITWSHAGAYSKSANTVLAGAVDIDKKKIAAFRSRFKGVPVFGTVDELMSRTGAEIVSICTPSESHGAVLKALARYPIKAIFCEKPIAPDISEANEMAAICAKRGIVLAVNHTRRWEDSFLSARELIADKRIGVVKAVSACYPARIFNMGTHLFDTIRMLIQRDARAVSAISANIDDQDPTVSGWIDFEGGLPCVISATGKREDFIFEIDVIGDKGRVRVSDDGSKTEVFSFDTSKRYSGYRELIAGTAGNRKGRMPVNDRFVDAVDDIAAVIKGDKKAVNCSGYDGLAALAISRAMLESAKRKGKPVKVLYR